MMERAREHTGALRALQAAVLGQGCAATREHTGAFCALMAALPKSGGTLRALPSLALLFLLALAGISQLAYADGQQNWLTCSGEGESACFWYCRSLPQSNCDGFHNLPPWPALSGYQCNCDWVTGMGGSSSCYGMGVYVNQQQVNDFPCSLLDNNPSCSNYPPYVSMDGCIASLSCDPTYLQIPGETAYGACTGTYNECDYAHAPDACSACGGNCQKKITECTCTSLQAPYNTACYPSCSLDQATNTCTAVSQGVCQPTAYSNEECFGTQMTGNCGKFNDDYLTCNERPGCSWTWNPSCMSAGNWAPYTQPCCSPAVKPNPLESGKCCTPRNSIDPTQPYSCSSGAECCSSACDTTTLKCCQPHNQACDANEECCSGYICDLNPLSNTHKCVLPNVPPTKPSTPAIEQEMHTAGTNEIHLNELIECSQNCPPSPYPTDDDGPQPVAMEYRWGIADPQGATAWLPIQPPENSNTDPPEKMNCLGIPGCSIDSIISLKSRACDGAEYFPCAESDPSNQIKVVCSDVGFYCESDIHCCAQPAGVTPLVCDAAAQRCKLPPQPPIQGSIDWRYYILALMSAILILAVAYMASYAFGFPALRAIVHDELGQVLATGVLAFLIFGFQVMIDSHLTGMLASLNYDFTSTPDPPDSMMEGAMMKIGDLQAGASGVFNGILEANNKVGQQSSRGIFCSFMGLGFSLVNCSQFNAFRGSLTAAAFTTTSGLADLYAQQYLLSLAQNYSFTLIIPLGLFLRCFKASRQAGGALIAIGLGFYTVYPSVIMASDRLLPEPPPAVQNAPKMGDCNPSETDIDVSLSEFNSYSEQLTDFGRNQGITFYMLVRVIFMSILNLIITLGFIRLFAHAIGSDIDVSALARIS